MPTASSNPKTAIFQSLADKINQALNLPVVVWDYDPVRNGLFVGAQVGVPRQLANKMFLDLDKPSLTGEAYLKGEITYTRDVQTDRRWVYKKQAANNGWRSALCAPFQIGPNQRTVVTVLSYSARDFTDLERTLITSLGAEIGALNEIKRRRTTLEQLIEVGESFERLTEHKLQAVLEKIANAAQIVTQADNVVLYPYDIVRKEFYDRENITYAGELLNTELWARVKERPRWREDNQQGMTNGVASLLLERGEVICEDVAQAEDTIRRSHFVVDEKIRAFMGIALRVSERLVGILYVNYRAPHHFDPEAQNFIRLFGRQAAIAIDNYHLFHEASSRAEVLKLLHNVGHSLAADPNQREQPEQILQQIVDKALEVLGADLVDFYEYDQTRDLYHVPPVQAGDRYYPDIRKDKVEKDDVIYTVASKRVPQYYNEVHRQAELTRPFEVNREGRPDERFVMRENIASTAAVPLLVGDELVGVMFANFRSGQTFPQRQRELIELFAQQAAVVVRNARYFRQRVSDLNALQGVYAAIFAGKDLNDTLKVVVQSAVETTAAQYSNLWLLDEGRNELVFAVEENRTGSEPRGDLRIPVDENSLNGWAALNGQPYLCPDVGQDWHYQRIVDDVRSELVVPLQYGSRTIGTLNVESIYPSRFGQNQLDLLTALAGQAALAIQIARLSERQKHLVDISHAVNATLDLDEVLNLILDKSLAAVGADHGVIQLLNRSLNRLEMKFYRGALTAKDLPEFVEPGEGITGWVAKHGKPFLAADVRNLPPGGPQYVEYLQGVRSELAVPIKIKERVIGVLDVEHPKLGGLDEADLALLESIADQAAMAIRNARLFEAMRVVNEMGCALSGDIRLEREQILELIHEEAGKLMDAGNMYVAFYNEQKDEVSFGLAYQGEKRVDIKKESGWKPRRGGRGATEEIIRTRQPILRSTHQQAEDWYAQPGREASVKKLSPSWIGVPMLSGSKVIGVIAAYHPEYEYVYNEDDREILTAIAAQAAIALDNAHLYYNVKQRLEALVRFNQVISQNLRLNEAEILRTIRENAEPFIDVNNFYIALYDEGRDEVRFPLAYNQGEPMDVKTRRGGTGRTEAVIHERGPILIKTRAESEAWFESPDHQNYAGFFGDSWLGVPMWLESHIVGVIATYDFEEEYRFDEQDAEILQAMANQAAIALQNAQLYKQQTQMLSKSRDELAAGRELTNLSAAIGTLYHRLNNLLPLIPTNLMRLKSRVNMADADIAEAIEIIERSSLTACNMVYRLHLPKAELVQSPVNINSILHDKLAQVAGVYRQADPAIRFESDLYDPMPIIQVATGQISEIFYNLMDNGCKAMKASGGQLRVASRVQDGNIDVYISDTGGGIAPEIVERLFTEPLPSRDPAEGLGMSLWLAGIRIAAHKGKISVAETGPQGTTMLVSLPITENVAG